MVCGDDRLIDHPNREGLTAKAISVGHRQWMRRRMSELEMVWLSQYGTDINLATHHGCESYRAIGTKNKTIMRHVVFIYTNLCGQ